LSSARVTGSRRRSVCSCGLRNAKLDRNTSPGHPWLRFPGICVSASAPYGYGPNHCEKLAMAFAALSATACTLRAGDGGGGVTTIGGIDLCGGTPRKAGCSITSAGAFGNDFSTTFVPYASTRMLPAFASARTYLPRLNPATGIGRSDVHRETFSAPASRFVSVSCPPAREICFPVATSVQFAG